MTTPFGYQGAYTDPTGFQYLINRYYDPSTGQFTQEDPLGFVTRTPYAYSQNNPVNLNDPLGMSCGGQKHCSGFVCWLKKTYHRVKNDITKLMKTTVYKWVKFVGEVVWYCYRGNQKLGYSTVVVGTAEGSEVPIVGNGVGAIIGGLSGCIYGYETRLTAGNQVPPVLP